MYYVLYAYARSNVLYASAIMILFANAGEWP
ncbi:hypothetical protein EV385_6757 [Krasilnikovia cinnamomea]|uniref:Uncharacterized protein n=1 Tax=Krasilnikovia cinnamomea TaxID=349313 RepID=A0A4Q7Z879_9ACTN|nr:hypothetical protein EV385_6757 [Krasilnikovia cinnamomea]